MEMSEHSSKFPGQFQEMSRKSTGSFRGGFHSCMFLCISYYVSRTKTRHLQEASRTFLGQFWQESGTFPDLSGKFPEKFPETFPEHFRKFSENVRDIFWTHLDHSTVVGLENMIFEHAGVSLQKCHISGSKASAKKNIWENVTSMYIKIIFLKRCHYIEKH